MTDAEEAVFKEKTRIPRKAMGSSKKKKIQAYYEAVHDAVRGLLTYHQEHPDDTESPAFLVAILAIDNAIKEYGWRHTQEYLKLMIPVLRKAPPEVVIQGLEAFADSLKSRKERKGSRKPNTTRTKVNRDRTRTRSGQG